MILTKRKKRIVIFFFYIYLIFGALLAWLVFFNSGLAITEKTFFEQEKQIFFKNNSNRIINDITISVLLENGEELPFMFIPKAFPGEEIQINIEQLENFSQAVLTAKAPFHISFSEPFALAGAQKAITYTIRAPAVVFTNNRFSFELEACNELGTVKKIRIQSNADKEFFSENPGFHELNLAPKECRTINYSLTPTKTGQTTVFFNIEVENNKDRISKTFNIVN